MNCKYYKVLSANAISPTTQFDYSEYLPNGDTAGKWLPEIESAKLKEEGYYASRYWNFWYIEGGRIFEVELRGIVSETECGVEKQVCAKQMRFLREVTSELLPLLTPKDFKGEYSSFNTGILNTGSHNTGNFNTGNYNTGSRNTGSLNSGDFNTGDSNNGMDNVGDFNLGSSNSGSHNVGHRNSGDSNNGSYNTGSYNVGNFNTGSFNTGNGNVGKWNKTNYCVGFFNTDQPTTMMFNKPVNLPQNKIVLPKWLNKPNLKESFWETEKKEIELTLSLPNFDYIIFEEITGISESDFNKKLSE